MITMKEQQIKEQQISDKFRREINIFMGHFDVVLCELLRNRIPIGLAIVEDKPVNLKVVEICQKEGIPVYKIVNYSEIMRICSRYKYIKFCFVASFGKILKKDFIDKCEYIINFHPGDVLTCRGRHPLPAAVLHGYSEMGITVHSIEDEGVDSGPILYRLLMPIDYNSSYKANEKRLLKALRYLTILVATDINEGRIVYYYWDVKKSIYFKPLKKEILEEIINSKSLKRLKISKDTTTC